MSLKDMSDRVPKGLKPALILVAVLVVGMVVYLHLRDGGEPGVLEASGTVEATEADLGFRAAGRIAGVAVREGEAVTRGAVLAALDAAELEAQAEEARGRVAEATAGLREMEAGTRAEELAEARAAVEAVAERAANADRDLARADRLYEGGAVTRSSLEDARTAAAVAHAELERARQRLSALEAGPRQEQRAAQAARLRSAEAALARTAATLDDARVVAPFAGVVTIRHREPGETVQPGQPVVTLMDPADRWVRIYIPENRIGAVHLGQEATIGSDTYPDRSYTGRVVHIASEAEFTPRNVQTREERVKLVYAVRVAITDDSGMVLKPGIPADVVLTLDDAARDTTAGSAPNPGPAPNAGPASGPGPASDSGLASDPAPASRPGSTTGGS
ncbi:MAG TPA: HlyD family efflux transporter periplasmic adaptor subunit [Longimicrobiales bacterium]|nr:HlyD family efflux transporter periplasmic adaptor subunit [Longimicrobiales bacterium]